MTSLKKLSEQEYDTKPGPLNGRSDPLTLNCRTRRSLDKRYYMRHSNAEKNLVAKKRVIKMLFVVVLEFFICWTPLYALQVGAGRLGLGVGAGQLLLLVWVFVLVDEVTIGNTMDRFVKIKCS